MMDETQRIESGRRILENTLKKPPMSGVEQVALADVVYAAGDMILANIENPTDEQIVEIFKDLAAAVRSAYWLGKENFKGVG